MNRRDALKALGVIACAAPVRGLARASVTTLIGNGRPGFSDRQVTNPYGLVFGPDGTLLFCTRFNSSEAHRIRVLT